MRAIASRPLLLPWIFAGALLAACGSSSTGDAGDTGTTTDVTTPTDAHDVIAADRGDAGSVMNDVTPRDVPTSTEGGNDVVARDVPIPPIDSGSCGSTIGPCNPITGGGCDAGMACIIAASDDGGVTTLCSTPGPGGYGTPCNTADGCLEGFACLGSVCRKLCCAPGDDTHCQSGTGGDPRGVCDQMLNGVPLAVCDIATACDWFAQDCPDANDNCIPVTADGTTQCTAQGPVAIGQPCGGSAGDCVKGSICITDMNSPTGGKCLEICDPTLPDTADAGPTPDGGVSRHCPSGLTCFGFNQQAMLPRNFGVCDTM